MPPWLDALLPTGIDRYTVAIGEHRVHVMEVGRGRPVLMVHGNPSWGFLYRKVMEELAGEPLRLIAPDLVGLGFSSRPARTWRHTVDGHGSVIGRLVDALDLRDVVLVGQDWGGCIGLYAFHERRERLTGMVMLNTVVGPPKPGFKATAFHRFARLPLVSDLAFGIGLPAAGMFLVQGDKRSIRGRVARAYRYPLRGGPSRNRAALELARMVPDSLEHFSVEAMRTCQEIFESTAAPVSLVWGDRDPVLGTVRGWLHKLRPDAEVTRTQAGHFLQEEVPVEIAEAIRSVVARSARAGGAGEASG